MSQDHEVGMVHNDSVPQTKKEARPVYRQQGVAITCRSYEEYMRMFALEMENLKKGPILDVAAGASSFVAEASTMGLKAIAVDPSYDLSPAQMERKAMEEIEISTKKLDALQEHMDWTFYGSLKAHHQRRERSLHKFITDYERAQSERYVAASLPVLPFADHQFSLVLCSHFLFLYGEQFDYEFHRDAIMELIRVCKKRGGEVRIYPLKTLSFTTYSKLSELLYDLGNQVTKRYADSRLPFIPGSTELLILTKA